MKTIVITGANSGIGKATALLFAQKGWQVAATMRNPLKGESLQSVDNIGIYPLDVTRSDTIKKARQMILSDFGTVDVLLNNAGYRLFGPFEKASAQQIKDQFETNVFGLMEVTRAFLPYFRERKGGMVVNISSIAGRIGLPFMSLYHATKWAVEGFSESLAHELEPFGISVKLIEPGRVAVDFSPRSIIQGNLDEVDAYDKRSASFFQSRQQEGGSSTTEYLAGQIFAAVTDGKPRLRYLVGEDAERIFARRTEIGEEAFVAETK
jgi:short-subunit dehydrogenase